MPNHYNPVLVCKTTYVAQIGCGIPFDLRYPIFETHQSDPLNRLLQTKATIHPMRFLQISFEPFPGMHYDIPVTSHAAPITIKTVINSLYAFFQLPLSQRDLQLLNEGQRAYVDEVYHRRVWKNGINPYTFDDGYKMLDLLLEDFVFHGIESGVRDGLPQWKLVLERNYPFYQYEIAVESSCLMYQRRDSDDMFSRRSYMPGNVRRSHAVMVPVATPYVFENETIQEPRSAPPKFSPKSPPSNGEHSDAQPLNMNTSPRRLFHSPFRATSWNTPAANDVPSPSQSMAHSQMHGSPYPIFGPPNPRVCSPWATSSNP